MKCLAITGQFHSFLFFPRSSNNIALNQFMPYLIDQQKLTCHQSGTNRLFHSKETLSLHIIDHLFKAVDERRITAMILIDLSKAFYSLSRKLLLCKPKDLGTSESSTEWFESYLSSRYKTTRIGCTSPSPLPVP